MKEGAALPVAVATWEFGRLAVRSAGRVLAAGGAALDAVERGINAVELDPEVTSVGLGGLPNAAGVVELDAMIMEGRSCGAGAVAALQRIATPISVARRLLELGGHSFLVGAGALEFARSLGFHEQELLTPAARARFEAWRARGERAPAGVGRAHDTVGLVAVDAAGRIAAGCSTSGLRFKAPGRVGDSPLVGAGAYCDDEVGGAAATGNGDAMLRFVLSFAAVEGMRAGLAPDAACRRALARMQAKDVRAEAALIAVHRSGELGAAAIGRDSFPFALWRLRSGDELERVSGTLQSQA